jgi:hypothetical protein
MRADGVEQSEGKFWERGENDMQLAWLEAPTEEDHGKGDSSAQDVLRP